MTNLDPNNQNAQILSTKDECLNPRQFEANYNNSIKFRMRHGYDTVGQTDENLDSSQYKIISKVDGNGTLYLCSSVWNNVITVNDTITIKNKDKNEQNKDDYEGQLKYEQGIIITTSMNTNGNDTGSWNVGFIIGDNLFCYHPDYNDTPGAARVQGPNGFHNESMGFVPTTNNGLHQVEIFLTKMSHIYVKVAEGDNVYNRDWQHHDSLFMVSENGIKLKPNMFGLSAQYSVPGWSDVMRVAQFGSIEMKVGKRNVFTGETCEIKQSESVRERVMIDDKDKEIQILKEEIRVLQEEQKKNESIMEELKNEIDALRVNALNFNEYEKWNYKQVLLFILSIQDENGDKIYEKYKDKLSKELEIQQLRGSDLKHVEKSDIRDMGIVVFREKNLLYQKIQELVNKNYANNGQQQYKNEANEGVNAPSAYL